MLEEKGTFFSPGVTPYLERFFKVTMFFKKNGEIDDYLRVGDLQI